MAFKLLEMAQLRWRPLDGAQLLPLVREGVNFADGSGSIPRNMSLSQLTINLGKPPDRDRRSTTLDSNSFFEPSVRSRSGFEECWIGLVTALESSSDHESHFNATSLHLHRDESLEVQYLQSGIFAGLYRNVIES